MQIKSNWLASEIYHQRYELDDEITLDEALDIILEDVEDAGSWTQCQYKTALAVIKETKNGIPLNLINMRPKYTQREIDEAKNLVSDIRRLKKRGTKCI